MASHLTVEYLENYGIGRTFIETGTYEGETVEMVRNTGLYDKIISIELFEPLFLNAVSLFQNDPRVKLYQGDSVDVLRKVIPSLIEPATFWLDAHASGPLKGGSYGPSPLIEELNILANKKPTNVTISTLNGFRFERGAADPFIKDHTIFIDDRRLLGSSEWGGVTEQQVLDALKEINPNYAILYLDGHQKDDVIVATTRVPTKAV